MIVMVMVVVIDCVVLYNGLCCLWVVLCYVMTGGRVKEKSC